MVPCSFKRNPSDPNCNFELGYFHGFFQESVNTSFGQVFAIVHSSEDPDATPVRLYAWQKGLFLNKTPKQT